MKVLSLFDGISCGMVALERAGIPVERYVAYEIDPNAIKISRKNYPMIEHCGDVITADFTQYRGFDLLIGGSPCQGFSLAGKQLNFDDPRSKLYFEFERAIREVRPKYFLFENVRMKKEIADIITERLGVEPIEINSSTVSAQNRKRLYWTNIPNVKQPADRGITLNDVIDLHGDAQFCKSVSYERIGRTSGRGRHYEIAKDDKSFCLTRKADHSRDLCAIAVGVGFRNRRENDGKLYRRYETHGEQKANALTTVQTDSMVCVPHTRKDGKTTTVQNGMIAIKGKLYPINLPDGEYLFRRFSPVEYERLQTLPDGYTEGVAATHRYKCLGNGWTVDVIAHIFANLNT